MRSRSIFPILVVAAAVLTATAWLRSAEYDEQYTLFIVGGPTRPVWPTRAFTAGEVRTLQAGHAGFAAIARELRQTDVHPPLYFWVVAAWRRLAGEGLFTLRLASVLFSIATLCVVALIARMTTVPAGLAMLLTLGCYGFTYTGTIARGFALAQLLYAFGRGAVDAGRTAAARAAGVRRRRAARRSNIHLLSRCIRWCERAAVACRARREAGRPPPRPAPAKQARVREGPRRSDGLHRLHNVAAGRSVVLPGGTPQPGGPVPAVRCGVQHLAACSVCCGEPARRTAALCRKPGPNDLRPSHWSL